MGATISIVLGGLVLLFTPSVSAAQDDVQSPDVSLTEFRRTWRDAWSRRDIPALASLVAEDVDWVAADGTWLKGRKAFQEHHARLFTRQFKEAAWKLLDERVQMIDPNVAVTISATQIRGDTHSDGGARPARSSVGTRIIARNGGKWLLKVAHNTIIAPVPWK